MNTYEQSLLSKVPILRILVPFIAGIAISSLCSSCILTVSIALLGIVSFSILKWALPHTPAWSMRARPLWTVPFTLLSMALGHGITLASMPPTLNTRALIGSTVTARVDDIVYKDYSMSIYATMSSARVKNKQMLDKVHKILITTRGCDYNMQPGDIVCFKGDFQEIKSMGNPDGFDYAAYMLDQGIRYSEHLPLTDLKITGHDNTFTTWCNLERRRLQLKVFASQLAPSTQNFVVATLLGSSRFITPDTRETFSGAGIAHLLALSGLHMGIIMGVMWFIFMPLDYMRLRKLRLTLTLMAVIAYAVFTGLSPSVVRSTIMICIATVGIIFYRKSITLNALASAALLILAISPRTIHSIGFQLSFITVASLVIFAGKKETGKKNPKNRIHRTLAVAKDIAITSTIAMISTIMLTAWYFSSVSLTSAIANIIILPLFPLAMGINITFLLLCGIGLETHWINNCVDATYSIIETIAQFSGETIPGHITGIYVTGVEVAIYYIALAMIALWYTSKHIKWLNWAIALVAIMIMHHALILNSVPHNGIVVFNDFKQTQVFSFSNGTGKLWVPDGKANVEAFKHNNKTFLAHYRIDSITTIDNNQNNRIINGLRITCAGRGEWEESKELPQKIKTDILVVTKKYNTNVTHLLKTYRPHKIILSGAIYQANEKAYEKECKNIKFPYHAIASQGAFVYMQ